MELFVDRATAHWPGFAGTPDNAAAVARICRRLDGLPLAIELAAALVRTLNPRQIASRLDDPLPLLTGGRRTVSRQRSLLATLDWSYRLLSDDERGLPSPGRFSATFDIEI